MPQVKNMLIGMPESYQDFECDALVVIAVKRNMDGSWQPAVTSCSEDFKAEDYAKMCLFAAEDIMKKAGLLPPMPKLN